MKHLDVVDGELAAVPVQERPVPGVIGQTLELFILKLRSPDAEVWTACTATSAVAGLDNTHFRSIFYCPMARYNAHRVNAPSPKRSLVVLMSR